jgi:hypothetical protein
MAGPSPYAPPGAIPGKPHRGNAVWNCSAIGSIVVLVMAGNPYTTANAPSTSTAEPFRPEVVLPLLVVGRRGRGP